MPAAGLVGEGLDYVSLWRQNFQLSRPLSVYEVYVWSKAILLGGKGERGAIVECTHEAKYDK